MYRGRVHVVIVSLMCRLTSIKIYYYAVRTGCNKLLWKQYPHALFATIETLQYSDDYRTRPQKTSNNTDYIAHNIVKHHWSHRNDFATTFYFLVTDLPEQANFEEIGPEIDQANFLSVHLTNPYPDNMAEPQQTRRHSRLGRQKSQDFLYLQWEDWCEPYHNKYRNI